MSVKNKIIVENLSWTFFNTTNGNFSTDAIESHAPVVEDLYVDIYIVIGM